MLLPGKVKIAVAKVIKPHGIHGELNVELTDMCEPDDDFAPGSCLIVEIDGLDVPFFVVSARQRGAESYLLTLDDVRSDSDAARLQNHTLYIYADPEEADGDEMQASQLVGFEVVDSSTYTAIGTVDSLTELTPGAWYFDVGGRLIPAVDEFITDIDLESRRVIMALPQGLLEL
ncbi:MAG: ribosome maturation factor RimM [Bacteroides sp.]|nr:ribosome maturation factor RimM [Bacteroides sp.]MCM1379399.1 ribosome maturation factor RimM [Bacteroides sp.]MCM1445259.1 ribosome maturation factor RimM [Prevotella sp.]